MARAPLFLARQGYRRRRLADMARLLPLFGLWVFLLPLLDADDGLDAALLIYLFSAWFILIAASALLARRLCADAQTGDAEGPRSR
ncbi:hypothetical protein EV663_1039 [Rhodovulum bhavnagarense]|uniref:Uncharacterized protein n=1 Tax=Rhodovulum bhavnagarense TaxID=992286 RepID=A0A4R2RHA9_9RHOB|nr:hypothetical protein [Rhodovulum bhavnagarense]TCP61829.1 hypothetical protein EV663_1039 [Rhodovulum bhavnagarense]